MCHDICNCDLIVFMEMFKISKISLSNDKTTECMNGELACVGASNASFWLQTSFMLVYVAVTFCCFKIAILHQCTWSGLIPTRPGVHRWAQVHLLFTQRGRENDNCVSLKLATNSATLCAALRQALILTSWTVSQWHIFPLPLITLLVYCPIVMSQVQSFYEHFLWVTNDFVHT